MAHYTTDTYTLKREIFTFSNKISKKLSKPDRKFTADMTYGMLASGRGIPTKALHSYLSTIRKWIPEDPVIHIDDSDIVKPDGRKFEALGLVRNSSKSTDTKNVYEKGYHLTEACVLTKSGHLVSIFSRIHSSKEKDFTSVNDVTFSAMERGASLLGKATFVMDRDMMTTRCSSSWTAWGRTMSSASRKNPCGTPQRPAQREDKDAALLPGQEP